MSRTLRLIPLLFLGVFAFGASAHASYTVWNSDFAGSSVDGTQPIDNIDLHANGDFSCPHGIAIFHLDHVDYTDQKIFGNNDYHNAAGCSGVPPAYASNINTVLSGGYTTYPHVANPGTYVLYFSSGNTYNQSTVRFYSWDGSTATDLGGIPPEFVAPIGDLNEVVRYWPSNNYATTTGTTTIGVQFSIAHPEWIEGVGYELDGTTDTTGSSTVAYDTKIFDHTNTVSTAQTFSVVDDYNFTQGGHYTISAFFIQNGQRVYNNSNATILINYVPPNIIVGSDGTFHFNGTTTVATSTLDALHIDCGDTLLVSSLCKIAVSFVVPDPSAIQGVQNSWNALLTKAPFSFFTQSRSVLAAFSTTTASTGGSFSLNVYGTSTPIVSSASARNIGISDDAMTALKFLISTGLWILVAWFVYWRIGEILARVERV